MNPLAGQAIGAGASAAAGIAAELIGAALQAGEIEKARALYAQAMAEFGDDLVPELEKVMAERVTSEFQDVRASPQLVARQQALLDRLATFGEGAMTAADEAQQRAAMEAAGGVAARGAAQAEQLAARRGLLRSGLSQALGQDAAQTGAQQASDIAAQLAAQRQMRQMDALKSMGGFMGQMRGQDWTEASGRAAALDEVNRFNATMAMRAQEARNKALMDKFGMQMDVKNARNQQRANMAGLFVQSGQNQRDTARNVGAGLAKGGETFGALSGKGLFS